jgi:glycosyltransferase involved in cell wall biosynthesis
MAYTHSFSTYHTVLVWNSLNDDGSLAWEQLAKSVQLLAKDVDIFHVHNEPNWIFKVVRENTDKPVVYDIHDWTSLRFPPNDIEIEYEKYAIDNCDAISVVSKGYESRARQITSKPVYYVQSRVPLSLFGRGVAQDLPGIVYEGGLKGKTDVPYNYEYRNWASFTKKMVSKFTQERAYFYSANGGEDFGDYVDPKVSIYQPVMYNELIQVMGRYTAGLVGSPWPLPDFGDAMPNKMFEYIAAGIPCVVINAPESRKFVEENGFGLGIEDASEVKSALEKLKNHHVLRDRWGFTMEGELPKILEMYREAISIRSPKRIARRSFIQK